MLKVETLPSLRNIAEVILSEGSSGQIILFCVPSENTWEKWKEYLLNAFNISLSENGKEQIWETLSGDTHSVNPQKDIAEFLELDRQADLNEILASYGDTPPIIVELLCNNEIQQNWNNFINEVARFLRVNDTYDTKRSICIFFISPPKLPPVKLDAGIRCYSFWNPLRWEEMRLLVQDSIINENAMNRAWRVSTYTGSANSDPELISTLIENSPNSLSELKDMVSEIRKKDKNFVSYQSSINRFHDEKNWDVPVGLVGEWLNNGLQGSTLDRGAVIPWGNITDEDFEIAFDKAVWREQVAGIFPLLMEITFFTSEIISKIKGKTWQKYIQSSPENGVSETEPGAILNIFHENKTKLGPLPDKIYKLLQELRITRNKLAHIEPVDFRDVNQIWTLFEQISKHYNS